MNDYLYLHTCVCKLCLASRNEKACRKRIAVSVYLVVASLCVFGHIKVGIDVVFLLELLALCSVEVVETCNVAAEACVIVVSYLVVDVVLCFVMVEVVEVRSADECAPESVYLMYEVLLALLVGAM